MILPQEQMSFAQQWIDTYCGLELGREEIETKLRRTAYPEERERLQGILKTFEDALHEFGGYLNKLPEKDLKELLRWFQTYSQDPNREPSVNEQPYHREAQRKFAERNLLNLGGN